MFNNAFDLPFLNILIVIKTLSLINKGERVSDQVG